MVVNQYSSLVLNRCELFTLRMMLSLILLVVLPTYVVPENLHHVFSEQLQASVLETAFPATDGNGRSSQAGLARYKSILESRLVDMLDKDGWIPARVLAKAISLDIDFSGLNKSVVPIRGQVTKCHSSPVCLDLACGKCFDPLTSLHGSCGLIFLASFTFVTFVSPFCTMRTFGACFVHVTFNPTFSTQILPGWALVSSGPDCVRTVG